MVTLATLTIFVGLHELLDLLISFALRNFPTAHFAFAAASATAFLVVGGILLIEMVQVFLPPARVMSLGKSLAPDREE